MIGRLEKSAERADSKTDGWITYNAFVTDGSVLYLIVYGIFLLDSSWQIYMFGYKTKIVFYTSI